MIRIYICTLEVDDFMILIISVEPKSQLIVLNKVPKGVMALSLKL